MDDRESILIIALVCAFFGLLFEAYLLVAVLFENRKLKEIQRVHESDDHLRRMMQSEEELPPPKKTMWD